ncbi:MAG TPA: FAD/NAD(P)-binding protein [Nitrosomonas mobilis]|nr:FAD/NAD(P)-binding protein [Nitrosomonas mobilis]
MADPMLPAVYKVVQVTQDLPDTATLDLTPVFASKLSACQPGQFNMLYAFGQGEVPISVSGNTDEINMIRHTIRAVGSVTEALTSMKTGDQVGLRGPFGRAWPLAAMQGKDIVLIAGGLGLAPLRPAIYHLLNHRDAYGQVTLFYGTRTPQDRLYADEFDRWQQRDDLETGITVDSAGRGWRGQVGVVTTLLEGRHFDGKNTIALICGPEVMMRFSAAGLEKRGVQPDNIYVSMERNMKCAIGFCGHCQYGPHFICKDGPVFALSQVAHLFRIREI